MKHPTEDALQEEIGMDTMKSNERHENELPPKIDKISIGRR